MENQENNNLDNLVQGQPVSEQNLSEQNLPDQELPEPELSEQELPEQERHRRSRRRKNSGCAGTVVYVIAVLGISVVLSLIAIFVANDVFAFVTEDAEVQLVVPMDTDVLSLAKTLDDNGVINYGSIFKLYVDLTHKNTSVMAGTYTLNPNMDYSQIVSALDNTSSNETVTITIPEGYTVEQVKQLLLENHVCTDDKADEALNTYPFKHEFLKEQLPPANNWLEGYLFPDTYEIYQNNNAVDAINRMLNNFGDKWSEELQTGADNQGITMREAVIVASMIEREAQVDSEFATIAGVIYNRLDDAAEFPYLQIDATVQYAVGHKDQLTQADLDVDSPYNTYKYEGLPPGPICNPGYKSLYAATHPEEHYYYYYVAMPDGTHLFANSNDEHTQNIATAEAAFAAQNGNG